jgi:3-deoxy-D-manno-octulosonic-acid transferase
MELLMITDTNWRRYLYTAGLYLIIPILLGRLCWRARCFKKICRERWSERFGFVTTIPLDKKVIWIHAVSLGETIAAVPLVKALLSRYSDYQIVMTSTTSTGSAQVLKQFGDKVTGFYLPYDLPGSLRRFFKRIHPTLGVIMETELWPNLLAQCQCRKIPLLLANARLSEKSAQGYRKIKKLTVEMLNALTIVAAQSASDGQRFVALGLDANRLKITGNIKFDIQIPADLSERASALRQSFGGRPVWVAASTHEGEEAMILSVLQKIKAEIPAILLILAPRHPERFAKVGALCRQAGFKVAARSLMDPVEETTDILLGDTMGELLLFYAAGDLAFVGGSWVPVGGHNLIEPAILHIPVLTGPYLHNFVDVSRLLVACGGAVLVENEKGAVNTIIDLMKNSDRRLQMGEKGFKAVIANAGALDKHLYWIEQILKK